MTHIVFLFITYTDMLIVITHRLGLYAHNMYLICLRISEYTNQIVVLIYYYEQAKHKVKY